MLPNNSRYIGTSSRWWVSFLERLLLVSGRIVHFRFFVIFDRFGHAKIFSFSFWNITELETYRSRTLSINPTNFVACSTWSDHFRKSYGWFPTGLTRLCLVSGRIVHFRFFVKFDRSEPVVLDILKQVSYPAPTNPMNVRTFSKWCLLLSQRISRVSERFVIFPFFVKFDRSGPVLFKQQAPIYPMKVKTISRWCLVLSEGILMVSERLVVFQFFVNFDRSGPAIILCFCAIMECVTYHQECS